MDLTKTKILLTGGSGFLGKHVHKRLSDIGCHRIVAPRSQECDLRDKEATRRLFETHRPECVIHLAAVVGGIGANMKNPGSFFHDNAIMGIQLIELARQFDVKKCVVIGTICAYPKFTPVPFQETDLWNGYPEETNAPYGLAKKMLLVQAQAYRKQYGFNAIYLLPVNLYGPGDNFDLENSHVIPALIRKCVEARQLGSESITLWGDGTPTREFLYVEDAARGIVQATQAYDGAEPVNLGSGQEISILELAKLVAASTGYKGKILWDKNRPNGQPRRALDTKRAQALFEFQSECPLREGIARTVNWYEEKILGRTEVERPLQLQLSALRKAG